MNKGENISALRGEPSYVWRAGQQRRLDMIVKAAGAMGMEGLILDNGCGVGLYVKHMQPYGGRVYGLEYDFQRAKKANSYSELIISATGEELPYADNRFDLILSHEVIEHVTDDAAAVREMVRVLRPGGRIVIFCPNRGYPFETHGIYWHGEYRFGNIPLVNYLPRGWRNRLSPHVRVYAGKDLKRLTNNLPVRVLKQTIIFGAYDNIIARRRRIGRAVRGALQFLERTPLRIFGLSHFWVIEKMGG